MQSRNYPQSIQVALPELSPRDILTLGIFTALFLITAVPVWLAPNGSADLLALWLAAEAFRDGAPLYPDATGPFTMRAIETWADLAAEAGYEGPVYPYLYPPIWATLLSFTDLDFATTKAFAAILNPILTLAISALTWRAMRPRLLFLPFVCIGQTLIYYTLVGGIALQTDQLQILVAFLLVLAVERDAEDAPLAAGSVMAVAAAIKLWPALFTIVWLARGDRRALAGFALTGGSLGLASIALAGWPAHTHMLAVVSQISHSLFSIPLTIGVDSAIMWLFPPEGAILTPCLLTENSPTAAPITFAAEKPAGWMLLGWASYLAILFVAARAARRQSSRERARRLWPALLAAVPLVAPLAWAYYFIPLFATLPWLLDRPGRLWGVTFLLGAGATMCPPVVLYLYKMGIPPQLVGAAIMTLLVAVFTLQGRNENPTEFRPAAEGDEDTGKPRQRKAPLRWPGHFVTNHEKGIATRAQAYLQGGSGRIREGHWQNEPE